MTKNQRYYLFDIFSKFVFRKPLINIAEYRPGHSSPLTGEVKSLGEK